LVTARAQAHLTAMFHYPVRNWNLPDCGCLHRTQRQEVTPQQRQTK
jgi:hypothetical protein